MKVPYSDLKEEYKKEAREKTRERNVLESNWKGKEYFRKYYQEKKKKPWFYKRNDER